MIKTKDTKIDQQIANMDDAIALPRKNGELVFDAPWEARAFGLAVALNEQGLYEWTEFSHGLAHQIRETEQPPQNVVSEDAADYYSHWLSSLEQLVLGKGLMSQNELEAWIKEVAQTFHDHDHRHEDTHHHHPHE
ncbi:MAG: nitrile hydratase accessory protein [Chloroflexota bacterium]